MKKLPPAERDLFSLSCDPLADVNLALDAALREPATTEAEPDRAGQLANILVHKVVHVIRTDTPQAVSEALLAVTRSTWSLKEEGLDQRHIQALKIQRAASTVLAAATCLSAPGAELALMRRAGHHEAKLLCTIADSNDQMSNYATLYEAHPDHRKLQLALNNLDQAALIAYDTGHLYSTSTILLGSRVNTNPEIMLLARHYAEQFDVNRVEQD